MSVNEKMTAIADAIREKTGDTAKLTLDAMAETIRKLPDLIVNTATGNPISLTDATDLKLRGLTLYGKTTQDGTPTPEAPVELVSAGAGGDIRTLILPAVKTLAGDTLSGIPVTSGGNYTDENGQQWVCDEVDFSRGVYVQRLGKTIFVGKTDESWRASVTDESGKYRLQTTYLMDIVKIPETNNTIANIRSSCFTAGSAANSWGCIESIGVEITGRIYSYDSDFNTSDISLWEAYLAENPMTVLYELATPIETPLSDEELAAYTEKYGGVGTVYGRTTQDGTPSPESPVELVNHADVCQSVLTSTPHGLRGIPVASGGSYTDETGQQWVCDEVDYKRGVHIQRIHRIVLDAAVFDRYSSYPRTLNNKSVLTFYPVPSIAGTNGTGQSGTVMMSNFTDVIGSSTDSECAMWENGTNGTMQCNIAFSTAYVPEATKEAFITFFTANPGEILIGMPDPIETVLSAEELAAYATLHTNYPNTTILNDAGAGMSVSYVADTKLYIDNKINAMAAAIVNA